MRPDRFIADWLGCVSGSRLVMAMLLGCVGSAWADTSEPQPVVELSQEERVQAVQQLCTLLRDEYVLAELGDAGAEALRDRLEQGAYDALDAASFADTLTASMQAVCKDRHLRVRLRPQRIGEGNAESREARRDRTYSEQRAANFGFEQVRRLEGNVGYVDLRFFRQTEYARNVAAATLTFLGTSDALIIDLRQNHGGSPSMVQLLASHFFESPTHLNSFINRSGDVVEELWTLVDVPGPELFDMPLFRWSAPKRAPPPRDSPITSNTSVEPE